MGGDGAMIYEIAGDEAYWFVFVCKDPEWTDLRLRVWAGVINQPAGFLSKPRVGIPLTRPEVERLFPFLAEHGREWPQDG